MAVYQLPVSPSQMQLDLLTNTAMFQDPFTGHIQTVGRTGNRWQITMQFTGLSGSRKAQFQAFIAKMRGQENRFFTKNHGYNGPRGTGAGPNPRTTVAGQTGTTLLTEGWSASQTVLREGDFFQIGNELKIVTDDVTSNGSGNATINFFPELRSSPTAQESLDLSDPTGQFILVGNQSGWSEQLGNFIDGTIVGIEDLAA